MLGFGSTSSRRLGVSSQPEREREHELPAMSKSELGLQLELEPELKPWSAQCWRLALTLMLPLMAHSANDRHFE